MALPTLASNVLRLKSEPCGQPQDAMHSSGILFNNQGSGKYLISSSQYVFNDPKSCHFVQDYDSTWVQVELSHWQWNGLALFTINNNLKYNAELDITHPAPYSCRTQDTAPYLIGFSKKSSSASETQIRTSQISLNSDRGTYPAMTEVKGGSIDSGFVGGLYCQEMQFKGLISNQYIEMNPGSSSQLEFWHRSKSNLQDAPLIIPIKEVQRFVFERLDLGTYNHSIAVTLEDQKLGKDKLTTGELEFETDCPNQTNTDVSDSPYPIGGTDPIGIGGNAWAKPGCIVVVRRSAKPILKHASVLDGGNWYSKALNLLNRVDHIELWYLYQKNTAFDYLDRNLNYSLQQFFADLEKNSQVQIMTHAFSSSTGQPGADTAHVAMRTLASSISLDIQSIYQTHKDLTDEVTMSMMREIYFICSAAMSEEYKDISLSQVDALLDKNNYAFSWSFIENQFFGNKPNLHSEFAKLRVALATK